MKDANIQGHQPCPAASSVQKMLRHDKQGSQSNPNTIAIHCTCTQGLCTINNGETKAKDTPMTSVRAASMCQWKKNGFSFPSCDPNIDMAHISHHAFTNGHQKHPLSRKRTENEKISTQVRAISCIPLSFCTYIFPIPKQSTSKTNMLKVNISKD